MTYAETTYDTFDSYPKDKLVLNTLTLMWEKVLEENALNGLQAC